MIKDRKSFLKRIVERMASITDEEWIERERKYLEAKKECDETLRKYNIFYW